MSKVVVLKMALTIPSKATVKGRKNGWGRSEERRRTRRTRRRKTTGRRKTATTTMTMRDGHDDRDGMTMMMTPPTAMTMATMMMGREWGLG
jgi:hypothetical protein